MSKIFLSHSSKDREFVNRLAVDLHARGLSVWYDQWELDVGDSLFERIQAALIESSLLLVVLSPNSIESNWVREELNAMFVRQMAARRVNILPVLYQDCELPPFLQSRVYADFRANYDEGMQHLLRAILRKYAESTLELRRHQQVDDPIPDQVMLGQGYGGEPWIQWWRESDELNVDLPELLAGTWVGATGKLDLKVEGQLVRGRYDWQGHELSGELVGEIRPVYSRNINTGPLRGGCITFSWKWAVTSEHGYGLFYNVVRDALIGGWWMHYDLIDHDHLIKTNGMPPHLWTFRRT